MTSERQNNASTLGWVRNELDETLQQAAQALEEYSQDSSDRTQLRFCMTYLHQVYGTLQMLELYGLSMLVEEMEQVLEGLVNGDLAQPAEGEETLMRGILSVSDYLERIQKGERDSGVLVLPLLNDLRAARGAPLLTESMLFAPDLATAPEEPRRARNDAASIAGLARQHRHRFQRALLAFLRGQSVPASLERMQAILDELDAAAGEDRTGDLFWIAAGVVDGLRNQELDSTTAVKSVLGQVDRQLKHIIDHGEQQLVETPPDDLLKNLLYYVARSGDSSERVRAIQERFALDSLLPDAQDVADNQETGGYRPGSDILQSVSDALREDLTTIKDALDLYVRSDQGEPERLSGVNDTLRRVADTLGMLGLGIPRRVVREQMPVVERMASGDSADEQELMEFARALLYVESALHGLTEGEESVTSQQSSMEVGDESVALQDSDLFDLEYRAVYQTAIREAVSDISEIKDALVGLMEGRGEDPLAGMDSLLRRLQGALDMLDLQRAGLLLDAAAQCIREEITDADELPAEQRMDALADTITGLEYYLEAVLENRSGRASILDVAENSVRVLGYTPSADAEPDAGERLDGEPSLDSGDQAHALEPTEDLVAGPAEETEDPVDDAATAAGEHADETPPEPSEPSEDTVGEASTDAAQVPDADTPAEPAPASRTGSTGGVNMDVAVAAEELDDEILEIFLEEADECLETIHEAMPRWRADPERHDDLITVRRMFHTLKGSGRLAGALLLGELAWSVERLLNRIIEGHVDPGPDIFALLDNTLAAIPELVSELQGGGPPQADIRGLMREAARLADGAPAPEPPPEQTPAVEADTDAPPPAEPEEGDDDDAARGDAESESDTAESDDVPSFAAMAGEPAVDLTGADADAEQSRDGEFEPLDPGSDQESPPEDGTETGEAASTGEPDRDGEAGRTPDPEQEAVTGDEPADAATPESMGDGVPGDAADAGEPPAEDGPADTTAGQPAMDATLYDIFRNETEDHLGVVRDFLAEARRTDDGKVTEEVQRSLHTLSGSARMADVDPVATLARELELLAAQRQDVDQPMSERDLDALERGADMLDSMVEALGAGQALPDASPLREELVALSVTAETPETDDAEAGETGPEGDATEETPTETAEPPADTSSARADTTDTAWPEQTATGEDTAADDEMDQDLVNLFLEEADDILTFLDQTFERWEDDPENEGALAELQRSLHTLKGGARLARFEQIGSLCHSLENLVNDVEQGRIAADDEFFTALRSGYDRLIEMVAATREQGTSGDATDAIRQIEAARGASGGHGGAAGTVADPADAEGDRELMDVFVEESAEILQVIEGALQAWTDDPGDNSRVQELERALHTLKGGARMAGYTPVANLSHTLETLLVRVRERAMRPDGQLLDLLERSHDRLHLMRQRAEEGESLPAADDLVQELAQWESPEAVPAPQPPAAEETTDAAEAVAPTSTAAAADTQEPAARSETPRTGSDQIRVRADLLDNLVNYAGEVSIYRARLDQQVGAFRFNLTEMNQTVQRLRDQLRTLEIETEAQILYRYDREGDVAEPTSPAEVAEDDEDFDPLELDRFSRMQELSRSLGESVNDLSSIESMLDNLARESETLLLQQSRVNTELQDGLMRTRMVPFASLVPRLRRIVRQTAGELGREARIKVHGAQGEMDRTVLDRVVAPLEHMLRNAVAHGIESPEARSAAGKPEAGQIQLALDREGAEVVLRVSDDGAGMNLDAIREKARERGLLRDERELTDRETMQFVLAQGFSTAQEVTQVAGRGVGMDVVNAEIKQLGGSLEIDSEAGRGTRFTVRLPFTLAMNQALLCTSGEQAYAIPLTSIDGVVRVTRDQMETYLAQGDGARYHYAGQDYQVTALSLMLAEGEPNLTGQGGRIPLVLLQSGDHRLALQVEGLIGSREIVVKSVGPQISNVPGIYGATILADGRVVLILEMSALMRQGAAAHVQDDVAEPVSPVDGEEADDTEEAPTVMVVDDSITMRKVATRLLERNNMQVLTASDGVDAVAKLQDRVPDAMLLDIEMPRMDGYELATHMRNDTRLQNIPIIMITSRTGEKHRQRAMEIGVDRYLGKPYQEADLLGNLEEVLGGTHGSD